MSKFNLEGTFVSRDRKTGDTKQITDDQARALVKPFVRNVEIAFDAMRDNPYCPLADGSVEVYFAPKREMVLSPGEGGPAFSYTEDTPARELTDKLLSLFRRYDPARYVFFARQAEQMYDGALEPFNANLMELLSQMAPMELTFTAKREDPAKPFVMAFWPIGVH